MLNINDVRIDIGARTLVSGATVRIGRGEKVALVGPNGAGKTTLLRAIAGQGQLTSGEVERPGATAYLQQETTSLRAGEHNSALDYLLAASPLWNMQLEMSKLTQAMHTETGAALEKTIHRYSDLQEHFSAHGGYELEANALRIATGVGLTEEALLGEVTALSGGQRRRLDLAAMLLEGGDLYLLDEPTNHLDAPAKKWVMNFLRDVPATVLMVSHDVKLMDSSIDRVIALENARLDVYNGTYSSYLKQRAETDAQRAHAAQVITKEAGRLEETKKIFAGANATHAKKRHMLQRRIDALNERLKDHAPRIHQRGLSVNFPPPARAGDKVLEVTGLTKSFGTNKIFKDVEFLVRRGDVMLLVGRNGAGKTTLLRCLAGRLQPDGGDIRLGANVKLGYYAQEHEDIAGTASVLENARTMAPDYSEGALRGALGQFGLTGDVAKQRAGSLSGGEKTKLALARLMLSQANLLLLDEPTNNLDPQSIEGLLAALQNYEGTVVLVSHDSDFVAQLAPERVLLLPESQLTFFDERVLSLIPQR